MNIRILKSCAGSLFSYSMGQEVTVDTTLGKDLIDAGYAEEIKSTTKQTKTVVKSNAKS